jgi:hypothetical protein
MKWCSNLYEELKEDEMGVECKSMSIEGGAIVKCR